MNISNINTVVISDESLTLSYYGVDGEDQRETQRRLAGAIEALLENTIEGILTTHVTVIGSTITFTNKHVRLQFSDRCHGYKQLLEKHFKEKLLEARRQLPTPIQYVPDLSAGFLDIYRDKEGVRWTWSCNGIEVTGKDCLYDIDVTDRQQHIPIMAGSFDLGRFIECDHCEDRYQLKSNTGILVSFRSEAPTLSLSDMLEFAKLTLPTIERSGVIYLSIN